jgi:hypothetical protein
MRVPDTIRDCVVYIYDGEELLGTGFLIGMPVAEGSERVYLYVATALHLVDGRSATIVSLNGHSGDAIKIDTSGQPWWYSRSPTADVAISFLPGEPAAFTPTCVRFDQIGDDSYFQERDIGPGDEVVFVGLLTGLPGRARNRPVVRLGQIAMMNEELVPQEVAPGVTKDVDAILVEALSWGGHSGSPAFVVFPPTRHMGMIELPKLPVTSPRTQWALLGLVAGHWQLPSSIRLKNVTGHDKRDPEREALVNAGIALVTPAQHIVDLLVREDVLQHREALRRQEILPANDDQNL